MMRSERKTEKWRIPGKWTLIFLLILLAFYGYQNILAENYERQVVSWIGQTEKDRTVSAFTEPDEEAYQKGCEALKEAGYEETGKIWLEKRIRRDVYKRQHADRPIITMSMAGTGLISRLCGEVFGSALTFGAVGKASAPGQMNASDLREILTLIDKSI